MNNKILKFKFWDLFCRKNE